jgi:sulfatase maturation enzyme AslB (radical SAM superfamily)
LPRLARRFFINFYGGEPLFNFTLIKDAVSLADELSRKSGRRPRYSLSTNGSLITDEIVGFFQKHRFALEIGFDGTAQEVCRRKGSSAEIVRNIRKLLACPDIEVEVNSVFTPATVRCLGESVRLVLDLGVPRIRVSFSGTGRWPQAAIQELRAEFRDLRKFALARYKKTGLLGVANFHHSRAKGYFYCAGGQDRFAIAPDGGIWGCFLFPGLFHGRENTPECRRYFFGRMHDPAKKIRTHMPGVAANYARLSLENFTTHRGPCLFCPEFESCAVCPAAAALSGASLGEIPDDICEIQRIQLHERREFNRELGPYRPTFTPSLGK